MDSAAFRRQFPVFEEVSWLNAGTCGPLPGAALRAGADAALRAAERGRDFGYFQQTLGELDALRRGYADLLHADPADVAVTTATSDGMVKVLTGMGLGPGDEILTAPDEHPGLLGPLAQLRRVVGVEVRTAPLASIHEAVTPATKLVACSHVSWTTGSLAPVAALAALDVPVLLDGAQSVGAIPIDVATLGVEFLCGAGQKWLCGPVGTGVMWIDPRWRERLVPLGPTYLNLETPAAGLDAAPHRDARAFDAGALSGQDLAAAVAALGVLAGEGWAQVHERARALAAEFAEAIAATGRTVAPRGATTLVSWEEDDPDGVRDRLAKAGIVVRSLPGTPYVRASVGAWNDASDLERLLAELAKCASA